MKTEVNNNKKEILKVDIEKSEIQKRRLIKAKADMLRG